MDPDEPSDADLIRSAALGEETAFDVLVRRHQFALRLFIARAQPDPEAVFEIVQETFIIAWRKRRQIDPDRDLGAWLRGVARRCVADWFRRQARRRQRERPILDESTLSDQTDEALAAAGPDLRLRFLRQCLAELRPEQRDILAARYRDGQAVQDLAAERDLSGNALSMVLGRLRKKLRLCVEHRLRQEPA